MRRTLRSQLLLRCRTAFSAPSISIFNTSIVSHPISLMICDTGITGTGTTFEEPSTGYTELHSGWVEIYRSTVPDSAPTAAPKNPAPTPFSATARFSSGILCGEGSTQAISACGKSRLRYTVAMPILAPGREFAGHPTPPTGSPAAGRSGPAPRDRRRWPVGVPCPFRKIDGYRIRKELLQRGAAAKVVGTEQAPGRTPIKP